ncbi:hypothetical protein C7M52_00889 [Mixta theicola]|nr:hypothetical protein C7M52_00889 [Mixta theicola]
MTGTYGLFTGIKVPLCFRCFSLNIYSVLIIYFEYDSHIHRVGLQAKLANVLTITFLDPLNEQMRGEREGGALHLASVFGVTCD